MPKIIEHFGQSYSEKFNHHSGFNRNYFNQQSTSRNREEELEIPNSFFQRMHQLHEDWLIHGNSSSKVTAPQVLVINADVDISILSTTYENLAALVWNTLPKELKLNKSTEN